MIFKVEYTKRAIRDLKSLSIGQKKNIIKETITLEKTPFPHKNRIEKIQGLKFPCYRLRFGDGPDSFRIFYGIDEDVIYILAIVSIKNAERIIKNFRNIGFPPESIDQ